MFVNDAYVFVAPRPPKLNVGIHFTAQGCHEWAFISQPFALSIRTVSPTLIWGARGATRARLPNMGDYFADTGTLEIRIFTCRGLGGVAFSPALGVCQPGCVDVRCPPDLPST